MTRNDEILEQVLSWADEPDQKLLESLGRRLVEKEAMGFSGGSFADPSTATSDAEKWLDNNTREFTEAYDKKEEFDDIELAVKLASVLSSSFPAIPVGLLSILVARRINSERSAMYEAPELEGVPEQEADPVSDSKLEKAAPVAPVFSAHATPQVIAERLRAAREAKGWTQQDLANAMGLKSRRTVQNLESAREGVTVAAVRSAMEALEIQEL